MLRLLLAGSLAALCLAPTALADPPRWAPVGEATIRPGAEMLTDGEQCTANFVFYDAEQVYLGYAAHCAPATGTYDCGGAPPEIGAPVDIEGATRPGRLAYSAYETMRAAGETDPDRCADNDFALVAVDPADAKRVNPTVPVFGGPTGLRIAPLAPGERMLSFGNSSLRRGIAEFKPREGEAVYVGEGNLSHSSLYITPAIFGDSGSGELDGAGGAVGVISTLGGIPPGATTSVDLAQALFYMRTHTPIRARLARGTEPFLGPQVLGEGRVASPASGPDPLPEPAAPAPQPPAATAPPTAATPPAATAPRPKAKRKPSCRRHRSRAARKRCERRRRQAVRRAAPRGMTSATSSTGMNHPR